MLIVYRINAGFEGRIITLDKATSAAEMDRWLENEAVAGRREQAYLEINEAAMDTGLLADLATEHAQYRVVDGALQTAKGAVDLGYDAEATAKSPMEALRQVQLGMGVTKVAP
jgi:hypothetical protein